MWGESFVPARDAGVLVPGKVIRFKAQIQVDDRTDSRRLTGSEINELKPRGASATKGALELTLWTSRHSERDLQEIRDALAANPGKVPVFLHFQNSAGKRATLELGENYGVRRSETLEKSLGRWMD
jgi:DNA polymerase-3 subunit alpha